MKRTLTTLVVIALAVVACGDGGGGTTTAAADTTVAPATTPTTAAATTVPTETTAGETTMTETTAASMAMTLTVAESDLGSILVDDGGNTVYLFVPDEQSGTSSCYDECEANWPPVTGDISAGDGVDAALLGTTERTDGTVQATYNDWPLYYFANDAAPGDTNGQGINEVWWVMDAEGSAIED